jgi:hypothetical protein
VVLKVKQIVSVLMNVRAVVHNGSSRYKFKKPSYNFRFTRWFNR